VGGGIGSLFATFSDSETASNNAIETGSLDLRVNGQDDEPWGGGIGSLSQITDAQLQNWHSFSVELWNAGEAKGIAYLRIKNLNDPNGLANWTFVEIWARDQLVQTDLMSDLNDKEIELGELSANEIEDVTLALCAFEGSSGDHFSFSLRFDLAGPWSDSEISEGNLFELMTP